MTSPKELLAKMNAGEKAAPVAHVEQEKAPQEPTAPAVPVQEEKTYQHYKCSRVATRMMTPSGKRINFVNNSFITDDDEIISFLDYEINNGLNIITKGERMSHIEADPMSALKRSIIKEYLAEQAAEAEAAAKTVKEFGNTFSEEELAKRPKPVNSGQTAT